MKKVLCVGYHNKHNAGDDLYRFAFAEILGKTNEYRYADHLKTKDESWADVIIYGGGSIMGDDGMKPRIPKKPFAILSTGFPVTDKWNEVCDAAKICAFRCLGKDEGNKFYLGCDASFILDPEKFIPQGFKPKESFKVGFIPNAHLVPTRDSPSWKGRGYEWFLNEVEELEELKDAAVIPMCAGKRSDEGAGAEIILRNIYGESISLLTPPKPKLLVPWVFQTIQGCDLIISTRLHGCIIAQMLGKPFVGISAHQKVEEFCKLSAADFVNFYGFRRQELTRAVTRALQTTDRSEITKRYRKKWQALAIIIREKLGL